jgi:hypothetical protein
VPGGAEGFETGDYFGGFGGIFGEGEGFAAREFEKFVIAQRLGN